MKINLTNLFIFSFLAIFGFHANSQNKAQIDTRWKMISNNDSFIRLRVEIKSNKSGVLLRDANFIFNYDNTQISFSDEKDGGKTDTDFFWQPGFNPNDSTYNTVTRLKTNVLSVNIHAESFAGVPLTTDTNFLSVIDIKFRMKSKPLNAKLNWLMEVTADKTFVNVFDKNFHPFEEGEGWSEPFIVRLE